MLLFTHLPERLGLESLGRFSFGNPDAAYAELIKDGMCLCKSARPVHHSLLSKLRGIL